jgi:hypothetical protein
MDSVRVLETAEKMWRLFLGHRRSFQTLRPPQAADCLVTSPPGKLRTAGWHCNTRTKTFTRSTPRLVLPFSIAENRGLENSGHPVQLGLSESTQLTDDPNRFSYGHINPFF